MPSGCWLEAALDVAAERVGVEGWSSGGFDA